MSNSSMDIIRNAMKVATGSENGVLNTVAKRVAFLKALGAEYSGGATRLSEAQYQALGFKSSDVEFAGTYKGQKFQKGWTAGDLQLQNLRTVKDFESIMANASKPKVEQPKADQAKVEKETDDEAENEGAETPTAPVKAPQADKKPPAPATPSAPATPTTQTAPTTPATQTAPTTPSVQQPPAPAPTNAKTPLFSAGMLQKHQQVGYVTTPTLSAMLIDIGVVTADEVALARKDKTGGTDPKVAAILAKVKAKLDPAWKAHFGGQVDASTSPYIKPGAAQPDNYNALLNHYIFQVPNSSKNKGGLGGQKVGTEDFIKSGIVKA